MEILFGTFDSCNSLLWRIYYPDTYFSNFAKPTLYAFLGILMFLWHRVYESFTRYFIDRSLMRKSVVFL